MFSILINVIVMKNASTKTNLRSVNTLFVLKKITHARTFTCVT